MGRAGERVMGQLWLASKAQGEASRTEMCGKYGSYNRPNKLLPSVANAFPKQTIAAICTGEFLEAQHFLVKLSC